MLEFEVIGKDDVAADIGEHGERAGGDDGAADGQPVEAVGKVDGVGGADQHKDDKDDEGQKRQKAQVRDGAKPMPLQVGTPALDERHSQLVAKSGTATDHQGDANGRPGKALQSSLARAVSPRLRRLTTLM